MRLPVPVTRSEVDRAKLFLLKWHISWSEDRMQELQALIKEGHFGPAAEYARELARDSSEMRLAALDLAQDAQDRRLAALRLAAELTDRIVDNKGRDGQDSGSLLLRTMVECRGIEVHRSDWPAVQALVDEGKARWTTGARGPDEGFRRAEPVEEREGDL